MKNNPQIHRRKKTKKQKTFKNHQNFENLTKSQETTFSKKF